MSKAETLKQLVFIYHFNINDIFYTMLILIFFLTHQKVIKKTLCQTEMHLMTAFDLTSYIHIYIYVYFDYQIQFKNNQDYHFEFQFKSCTHADCTVVLRLGPCSCTIRAMLIASQMVSSGVRVQGVSLISLSIVESLMVVHVCCCGSCGRRWS